MRIASKVICQNDLAVNRLSCRFERMRENERRLLDRCWRKVLQRESNGSGATESPQSSSDLSRVKEYTERKG